MKRDLYTLFNEALNNTGWCDSVNCDSLAKTMVAHVKNPNSVGSVCQTLFHDFTGVKIKTLLYNNHFIEGEEDLSYLDEPFKSFSIKIVGDFIAFGKFVSELDIDCVPHENLYAAFIQNAKTRDIKLLAGGETGAQLMKSFQQQIMPASYGFNS